MIKLFDNLFILLFLPTSTEKLFKSERIECRAVEKSKTRTECFTRYVLQRCSLGLDLFQPITWSLTSCEFKSDPKNKSPAIALFLFVGYILSFVIRFIVNAPDSLIIKHELDLEGFEHRDSPDCPGTGYVTSESVFKLVSEKSVHFEKKCLRKQSAMF